MWSFRLAVDYGTASTVAVLQGPDGVTRQLLFDGQPWLPSGVFALVEGGLLAGREAHAAGLAEPLCYAPHPKRHIDDLTVVLRERAYQTTDLIAATLNRVATEAQRVAGGPLSDVVLTAPAQWGQARRMVLVEAAARAGLPTVRLLPEAVAAAQYFASIGHQIPLGAAVAVYDLGAGTFDVSVLQRGPAGFETLAHEGLADVGGLAIEAAQAAATDRSGASEPGTGTAGAGTGNAGTDRAGAGTGNAATAGAGTGSAGTEGTGTGSAGTDGLAAPGRSADGAGEASAAALIARTVEVTGATTRAARLPREQYAGVFLVGGATRMPLVATMLRDALGIAPISAPQPELVIAYGAIAASGPPPAPQ